MEQQNQAQMKVELTSLPQAYEYEMLKENPLPFMVPMKEGETLQYDLIGCTPLQEFVKEQVSSYYFIGCLFGTIRDMMSRLLEYLVDPDDIVLSPEHIVVTQGRFIKFCLYVGYQKKLSMQLADLIDFLLPLLDYTDDELVLRIFQGDLLLHNQDIEEGKVMEFLLQFDEIYQQSLGESCGLDRNQRSFSIETDASKMTNQLMDSSKLSDATLPEVIQVEQCQVVGYHNPFLEKQTFFVKLRSFFTRIFQKRQQKENCMRKPAMEDHTEQSVSTQSVACSHEETNDDELTMVLHPEDMVQSLQLQDCEPCAVEVLDVVKPDEHNGYMKRRAILIAKDTLKDHDIYIRSNGLIGLITRDGMERTIANIFCSSKGWQISLDSKELVSINHQSLVKGVPVGIVEGDLIEIQQHQYTFHQLD